MSKIMKFILAAASGALLAEPAMAAWTLNLTPGVTELSHNAYRLHMLSLYICVAIGIAVFGVMIYSIFAFRKSQGAKADVNFTHSTTVEIIWTVIPVIILIAMAIPAARALVTNEDMRNSKLTIKVTGYQWKWEYNYLDDGVDFFSTLDRTSNATRQTGSGLDPFSVPNYLLEVDNPLVVPVNTKVRLLVTAGDVIHAWWVPALGIKKDAIPGFINELWFETSEVGIYRGQCAELCGRDHGFMPIVVDVKSAADYKTWLDAHKAKPKTDAPAATAPTPPAS